MISAMMIAGQTEAAEFRAGLGRTDITPDKPIWMSGYASRKHPSEGIAQRLWAKALALDDGRRGRAVIVTTDLIGLPRTISDEVAATVQKQYGLERSQLLLNSSHTHTGPVVRPNLKLMYDLNEEQERTVAEYSRELVRNLVAAVGAALGDLKPAEAAYGTGQAGFAANRREFTPKGVRIGVNPNGPVDHSVPVLRITTPDGKLRAVLFGYACHNTTLTGEFYQISGDYAGFAQAELEESHPGATAMFLMLSGADQNPHPRSAMEHVKQHGQTLAAEVSRVLDSKLEPVNGPVRAAFQMIELPLSPHTRETFEQLKSDENVYKQRLSQMMLEAYEKRSPPRTVAYPVQALRLGKDLGIVALGGEVVVDYALQTKREFAKRKLIVAGYSNDVMCYIPTARILKEGGYEAVDSMVYYGQPTPFTPQVEELVMGAIRNVVKRVGL
jgi:hypothetical protein